MNFQPSSIIYMMFKSVLDKNNEKRVRLKMIG